MTLTMALAALASTSLGGLFALKHRDKLHLMMGFAAGVVVGLVCFDLLPEIFERINDGGYGPRVVMTALACGFFLFHVVEKSILVHHHADCEEHGHRHPRVGAAAALALAGHSFMDGVGIGLGFQMSWKVGVAVAVAVISHDFVDGMNTVVLMVGNRNTPRQAVPYLALDAAAPVFGALSTLFFHLPAQQLTLYLGFFAGFLLYIGASHILPEAHVERASAPVVALTILGALFAFGIAFVV